MTYKLEATQPYIDILNLVKGGHCIKSTLIGIVAELKIVIDNNRHANEKLLRIVGECIIANMVELKLLSIVDIETLQITHKGQYYLDSSEEVNRPSL